MATSEPIATEAAPRRVFSARKWVWPAVYLLTVLALLTWYEIVPRLRPYIYVQGDWRASIGFNANERVSDSYVRFSGNTKLSSSRFQGDWAVRRSSVTFTPASDFYLVRRTYNFGKPGHNYESEHIIYLLDGKLYELRGLAPLDPVKEVEGRLLRRVDELPADLETRLAAE